MLAIPITKDLSWRNSPIVTLILILLNVVVFTVIQRGDEERSNVAQTYYFQSGLDKLEFPLYKKHLKNNTGSPERDSGTHESPAERRTSSYYLLNFDNAFLKTLPHGIKAGYDTDTYNNWRHSRTEFEQLLNRVVITRHGFRPAAPRLSTLLTSMFLHGDLDHLIGNMLFLWLVGAAIELGCRRWVFLSIYLVGGLMASGLFALCNLNNLGPAIGASGAISGIMGSFCVLYGRKKVKFFITLGFYFNYLKIPALVMLPLWIGNEIVQMISTPGSQVAYSAHLGGLLGGAALTRGLLLVPNLFKLDAFDDATTDPVDGMIEKALNHMGELDFNKARELLVSAQGLRPNDPSILTHLFNIDRQSPNTPQLHKTASTLLDCLTQNVSTYEEAYQIYTQYLAATHKPKLSSVRYARLSQVFSSLGRPDEARKLIAVLLKHCPNHPMLPTTLMKLASAHAHAGDSAAHRSCLALIRKQYPQSNEAQLIESEASIAK